MNKFPIKHRDSPKCICEECMKVYWQEQELRKKAQLDEAHRLWDIKYMAKQLARRKQRIRQNKNPNDSSTEEEDD
jgi:hypothetical protein